MTPARTVVIPKKKKKQSIPKNKSAPISAATKDVMSVAADPTPLPTSIVSNTDRRKLWW